MGRVLGIVKNAVRYVMMNPQDRFLSESTDMADFERRMKLIRDGKFVDYYWCY